MDDKQLGASLVKLDAAGGAIAIDADEQTRRILASYARWIRGWTIVAVVLWIPAVLLILGVLVNLGLLFPQMAELNKLRDGHAATPGAVDEEHEDARHAEQDLAHAHSAHELNPAQLERDTEIGFKMMSVLTGLAVLALSLALLCSFVVTLLTRRATLREINGHLAVISAELKRKQPSTAKS